ncbi:MAG: gliding motility-associated C-terminal domain-containing protein [Bacteroidota bacterium]
MKYTRLLSLLIFFLAFANLHGADVLLEEELSPTKINCVTSANIVLLQADTCGLGGVATVTHNGTGPITFIWSADPTIDNDTITGLQGGQIYTIQVRDTNGCLASDAIFIPLVTTFTATGFTTPDTCLLGNGTAGVLISDIVGGVPPYSFQWDANADSQQTPIAVGLSEGNYLLTITDDTGCQFNYLAQVDSTANGFTVGFGSDNVSCFGDIDGSAFVNPNGGNGNYDIQWLLPDSTLLEVGTSINNLSQGNYIVIVDDGGGPGCRYIQNFTISEPDSMSAGFLSTPAVGCTSPDGSLAATVQGGTGPYNYLWQTGDTTITIDSLAAGSYQLVITDDNGCTAGINALVQSQPGPFFTVDILQQDNCGLGEGIAFVNVSVGTPPYSYQWSTNPPIFEDTSAFANGLRRGTGYNVVVTGADSCVQLASFNMPGREPLAITNVDVTNSYCDLNNGSAGVTLSGGTAPYEYTWTSSPPTFGPVATNLPEGPYTISIRDSFNCFIEQRIEVFEDPGFELEVSHTDESCFGREDGTASAVATGFRGNVTYQWTTDPPQAGSNVSRLTGNNVYSVTVTDEGGCVRSDFVSIEAASFLQSGFQGAPDTLVPTVLSSATFDFTNNSIGAESYIWDFGDGTLSTEFEPTHTYQDLGEYFVQLKAFNADESCVDSILLGPYVVVPDGIEYVANAFSPNQDGVNDFFEVRGLQLNNFQLTIYNKWGVAVFTSNNPADSWDGNLRGGGPAPEGVYIYRLEADIPGEKKVNQTGTVTLVR